MNYNYYRYHLKLHIETSVRQIFIMNSNINMLYVHSGPSFICDPFRKGTYTKCEINKFQRAIHVLVMGCRSIEVQGPVEGPFIKDLEEVKPNGWRFCGSSRGNQVSHAKRMANFKARRIILDNLKSHADYEDRNKFRVFKFSKIEIETQGPADGFFEAIGSFFMLPKTVSDAVKGASSVASAFEGMDAADLVKTVIDAAKNNVDGEDSVRRLAKAFGDSIKETLAPGVKVDVTAKVALPIEYQVAVAIGTFVWFYKNDDSISRGICFGSFLWLCKLMLDCEHIKKFISDIFVWLYEKTSSRVETQGIFDLAFDNTRGYMDFMASTFITCGLVSDRSEFSIPFFSSIYESVKKIDRVAGDFCSNTDRHTFKNLRVFIDNVTAWVSKAFGKDWYTNFAGNTWADMEYVREELTAIQEALNSATAPQLFTLRNRLEIVIKKMNSVKLDKAAKTNGIYASLLRSCVSLKDVLTRRGAYNTGERPEPFFILFTGPPGVGKSALTMHTIQGVASKAFDYGKSLDDGMSPTMVWAPNQSESFDSGYHSQPIVYIDDFGADTEANTVFIPKMINWINTMPHVTNQAAVEDKGNVMFTPELVVATSNILEFATLSNTLKCPEALIRRLHFPIYVECKPEFRKPHCSSVDYDLVNAYISKNPQFTLQSCFWITFKGINPGTGKVSPCCACSMDRDCGKAGCKPTLLSVMNLIITAISERRSFNDKQFSMRKTVAQRLHDESLQSVYGLPHEIIEVQGPGTQEIETFPGAFEPEPRKLLHTCSSQFQEICLQHGKGERADMIEMYEDLLKSRWSCNCCSRGFSNFFRVEFNEPKCIYDGDFSVRECGGWITRPLNLKCEFEIVQYQIAAIRYLNGGGTWKTDVSSGTYNFVNKFLPLHRIPSVVRKIRQGMEDLAFNFVSIVSTFCSAVHTAILYVLSGHPKLFTLFSVLVPIITIFLYRWVHKPKVEVVENFETQMMDDNACSLSKSLVMSSVLRFEMENGVELGMGLAIGGELVITNHHIYEAMLIKTKLEPMDILIKRAASRENPYIVKMSHDTLLSPRNVFYFKNKDLVCIRVEKFAARKITQHFSNMTWNGANARTVGLSYWENSGDTVNQISQIGEAVGYDVVPAVGARFDSTSSTFARNSVYESKGCVRYSFGTQKGACGAPIILYDKRAKAKLVGIHAAGVSGGTVGFGIIITKDMIDEVVDHFKPDLIEIHSNAFLTEKVIADEMPKNIVKDCQVVGRCEAGPPPIYKSEIGKSPFHGKIEGAPCAKRPAILTPKVIDGRLVDPIENGMVGYARGWVEPPRGVLTGVSNALLSHYRNLPLRPRLIRELTNVEAVMGTPELPNLHPLNRGTSAGFPDKLFLETNNKRSAFGEEEWVFDTKDAELIFKEVDEMYRKLDEGPIATVCSVFPKDELRSLEKVKNLKTRLIMAAPLTTLILGRRIFGSFIDWSLDQKNRLKNFSAVGMNMANEQELRDYIHMMGGTVPEEYRVLAGDQSGYDKKLGPFLMDFQFEVFEQVFSLFGNLPADQLRRAKNMYYSCTRVFTQVKDNLIFWGNSNPSGWYLTTFTNTYTNVLATYMAIAIVLLGKNANKFAVEKLVTILIKDKVVEVLAFGDDIVIKIKRGIWKGYDLDLVNDQTLADAYLVFGHVYTDESKSTDFSCVDRTIFDVGFLKRTVRYYDFEDGHRTPVAFLDLETILQNIQWLKRQSTEKESLEIWNTKFDKFMDELSIHPDDVWSRWSPILEGLYQQVAVMLPQNLVLLRSRDERAARWCSGDVTPPWVRQ